MSSRPFHVDAEGVAALFRLLQGFGAIACLHLDAPVWAGFMLVLCVWTDALTGWIFRRLGSKSPDTSALENGADLVCFVIAPMEFAAALAVHPAILVLLPLFLVASVYRLARFQVEGLVHQSYRGLPVTYNGYWFPLAGLAVHVAPSWGDFILVGTLVVTSTLMVSRHLFVPEL